MLVQGNGSRLFRAEHTVSIGFAFRHIGKQRSPLPAFGRYQDCDVVRHECLLML